MSKAQVTLTFEFKENVADAESYDKSFRNGYVEAQRDLINKQIDAGLISVDALLATGWVIETS